MTNDQLEKSALNMLLFPVIVFLFCVGLFLVYDFWRKEAVSRELAGYIPVEAEAYALERDMRKTSPAYTYTMDGKTYQSNTFTPYPDLDNLARNSAQVRALTTRTNDDGLVVFVDPDDPARSSVLRAWPREGRLGGIALGGVACWLGCVVLVRMVRKSPRYDLLFRGG